jgi:hypothetical protein
MRYTDYEAQAAIYGAFPHLNPAHQQRVAALRAMSEEDRNAWFDRMDAIFTRTDYIKEGNWRAYVQAGGEGHIDAHGHVFIGDHTDCAYCGYIEGDENFDLIKNQSCWALFRINEEYADDYDVLRWMDIVQNAYVAQIPVYDWLGANTPRFIHDDDNARWAKPPTMWTQRMHYCHHDHQWVHGPF